MDELLFSLNIVLPLLLLALCGFFLKKFSVLPDSFYQSAEKLVFKVALPCSLFLNVYDAKPEETFDARLIIFCVAGIAVTFFIPCIIVPIFIKDNAARGAFIQGVYRSNFAILGLPIAERLFAESGKSVVGSLMPFTIPLFNIFAVTILSIFAPSDKKLSALQIAKKSVIGIITNPLIIGIALALPFMLLRWTLPSPITATVDYLGKTATPLALLCLGASMCSEKKSEKSEADSPHHSKLSTALCAAVIRVAVIPAVVVAAAILLGFTGVQLGVIFILFGAPTAVSSYIMAKNMKSDYELAGKILLLSTALCSVTVFIGIYLLKTFSLI